MFPSGVAHYDEELKYLVCLLRALLKPSHLDFDDSDVEATIPLWDLLTDKPVDGANKVTSLLNWSGTAINSGGNGTQSGGKISWDGEPKKWALALRYQGVASQLETSTKGYKMIRMTCF
ncbi:hypothetical protein C8J57DRAFT_1212517 [Mycena rebaudengoi]|nr:hypothetical protein C8J57DRAFT_1212517 [Mycena rebaudengoi]